MQASDLRTVSLARIEQAFGAAAFGRGGVYADQKRVNKLDWDDARQALTGKVAGSAGHTYSTTVFFESADGTAHTTESVCDCPVGFNCKHAVALILTARALTQRHEPSSSHVSESPTDAWERSLDSLVARGQPRRREHTELGVQFEIIDAPQPSGPGQRPVTWGPAKRRLSALLVRQGKRPGTWTSGGLSWFDLPHISPRGDYLPQQLQLLRELYALYGIRSSQYAHYNYNGHKDIDFALFDSPRLWPVLAEAVAKGVRLVPSSKTGAVELGESATFSIDVARDLASGELVLRPQVLVDGALRTVDSSGMPGGLGFFGTPAHGVFFAEELVAGGLRVVLAPLIREVPARFLELLESPSPVLQVPAEASARFAVEYYPRLRREVHVDSADGSFQPPEIGEPLLLAQICYRDGPAVAVGWEWSYPVGGEELRLPLRDVHEEDQDHDVYRDAELEDRILSSLPVELGPLGLLAPAASPHDPPSLAPAVLLSGLAAARFAQEAVPALRGDQRVRLEVQGSAPAYRDVGATLRIGVSAGEADGKTDWFDLSISIYIEERPVPFQQVFDALASGQSQLILKDGAYFSLQVPELQTLRRLIEESRQLSDSRGKGLRISKFQVSLWEEFAALGVVEGQARTWREQIRGLTDVEAVERLAPPAALTATLRPYQQQGFQWLAFLWGQGLGGILADDMGLGKTVQALALICHARATRAQDPPFLIIAPTSVVGNWATEAAKFAPDVAMAAIDGTAARRGVSLAEAIAGAEVVVTSYTLFRLEFEAYAGQRWSGVILDEAQAVKNHQSKAYQCVRAMATPFTLAITGTPMENNLMELWSLLSITAPGLFPQYKSFNDYYCQPIEKQNDTARLAQLRRRIKPLILRRTKELVTPDLPARQEQVLEVELAAAHRHLYEKHLQRERQKVLGLLDDYAKHQFTILQSLTLLRQLSLDAALVDEAHDSVSSAKTDALVAHLHEVVAGGHRALVFSQFTGYLARIRQRLAHEGIAHSYLDGKTRNRARVIDDFKTGDNPAFLISLKAGGVGLNLTEADYCFLMDPWWNPATEAQAVDRTHRIGQTKNVMVYRIVAKDTIEEKVLALKAKKSQLFSNVFSEGEFFDTSLTAADLHELFSATG